MKVSIELPDITGVDQRYLKEALVATRHETGKLSEKQARQIVGMTRRAFEDMLYRFGFSVLVDNRENLNIELKA
jgi:molecular chaperone GrpE (heat shock protein)